MRPESSGPRLRPEKRPPVTSFEDLIAWQRARALTRDISAVIESPALERRRAYRDQLHRAAVSIMSNIAEGFERGSRAEFHHMLSIAKGSAAEVRSLLFVGMDAGYFPKSTFDRLMAQATEVSLVLGGLRASVGRQRSRPPA